MTVVNNDSDAIKKIADGDVRAFQAFFKTRYSQVFGFALSLVKNRMDADDIAQTVFVRLWRMRYELDKIANVDHYLYRMTRNIVFSFLSSKHENQSCVPIDGIFNLSGDQTPEDLLEVQDTQLLIDLVVEGMPTQRRKVYTKSRVEGLSNEEIARQLGIEKKTVENHLNLAFREIRKAIMFYLLLMLWG